MTAGTDWRLLVHTLDSARGYPHTAVAHTVAPAPSGQPPRAHATEVVLPGALFDELVVGSWLHVEEMGAGDGPEDGRSCWWMHVGPPDGGITLTVSVGPDGHANDVQVEED